MTEQIKTLCQGCRDELGVGGFRVVPIQHKTTTPMRKACEWCGQRKGGDLKQYIVSGKGGRNG